MSKRAAIAVLAVLMVAAVGACSEPGDGSTPTTRATRTESRSRFVAVLNVVQLSGPPFGPVSAQLNVREFRIGKAIGGSRSPAAEERMDSIAVVFPPISVPGRCLNSVRLVLHQTRTSRSAKVSVYPSAAAQSLAAGRVPPGSEGGPATLLDNRPKAELTLEAGQTDAEFDVTAIARLWADGAPFPSQARRVEPSTPFVLIVRAPDAGPGRFSVVSESRPTLELSETNTC
jgi:hypothetical protein